MKKIIFFLIVLLSISNIALSNDINLGINDTSLLKNITTIYINNNVSNTLNNNNYKQLILPKMMLSSMQQELDPVPRFDNMFLSVFLNMFPGFGAGSFWQGNNGWGIAQLVTQISGIVFYGIGIAVTDKQPWEISHGIVNIGHITFFGGMLMGVIAAIVYEIDNPRGEYR